MLFPEVRLEELAAGRADRDVLADEVVVGLQFDDVVRSPSALAVSLGFAIAGSCTAGLAVGAVSERETESMLFLIGLVSLTLVVPSDSALAKVLPMFATDEYAWAAVGSQLQPGSAPWTATALVSAVLGLAAVAGTLRSWPAAFVECADIDAVDR